jgi:hypothetical protein
MLRLSSQSRFLLAVVCVAMVAMRLTGAHLHYCFDGREPPVTLHADGHTQADSHAHHLDVLATADGSDQAGVMHDDLDVSVSDGALVKKAASLFDPFFWIAASVLLCLLAPLVRVRISTVEHSLPIGPHRAHLRPPLRGPPVLA